MVSFTTLSAGDDLTLSGSMISGGAITNAGGVATLSGIDGIALSGLNIRTGTLTSQDGAIVVTGLGTGSVGATGRSIDLTATGALSALALNATAGDLTLRGTSLNIVSANATGNVAATATAGRVGFNTLHSDGDLMLAASTVIAGNTLSAGGTAALNAPMGITLSGLNVNGRATLTAPLGTVDVAGLVGSNIAVDASAIRLAGSGAFGASSLIATGGFLDLNFGGNVALGSASAATTLSLNSGGTLTFVNLRGGTGATLNAATTISGTTLNGAGTTNVIAPGGIDIVNLRTTGAAALQSSGAVRITNDLAASSLTASGSSLFLRSLGSIDASSLNSTSGAIDIGTAGALSFGTLTSAGATTLTAGTMVTGTTLTSGAATTVTAPGGITLGTVRSSGATTLTATDGALRVNTQIAASSLVVEGSSVYLRTPGALSFASIRSTIGDVDVLAAGDLTATSATAAGALMLASGSGNLSVGSIGGQFNPTLATLTAPGSITLGDAAVRTALNLTAGTTATLNGTMTAPTIAIRSADIAISTTARVGSVASTSQLSFTSTAGTTTVGGNSTGTGYRLSEAEFQRAFANNITVATASTGQQSAAIDPNATPALTLETLSLSAAVQGQQATGNLGSSGTLRFQTPGTLRVTGPVRVTGANSGNRLELAGGPAIQVRPGGSAGLANGTDLAGTLVLTAADIIASDTATLAGLSTAIDAKAQSDLLGANAGATDDTGYFAANAIVANVSHGLFVQNSGAGQAGGAPTYDQRRGLTFGSGGLTISPAGQTTITVAINGRQVSSSATGGFVTGASLVPVVQVTGVTLASGSTINGCAISNPAACTLVAPPPPLDGFDPSTIIEPGSIARDTIETSDLLDDELEAASNAINRPNVLVELPGFSALLGQPLIEDPVTGSGNDDLLADKDGKACDPATETCTKD